MGLEKKRMSKRIPLRKKYKLKKKIADHNRKIKKAAKKNTSFVQKKINKSLEGRIPNSYPFKEDVLKNIQLKKELRKEDKKDQEKEARYKEQDARRKLSSNSDMHTYASESMDKDLAFTAKHDTQTTIENIYKAEPKDNSMGAYYREFKKVVESADVIIEVLDARDPMGCRCLEVENTIITSYPNKKIILLLNKIDLVPRQNVEKWMAYLRNSHPTVAFKSSIQRKGKMSQSKHNFATASTADMQNQESLGADALLQLLKHYAHTGKVKTSITVGLIGFPNVGKSSVINSLCRIRAAKVGATPGVTKTSQEIHLDKRVKLLDTPGIVFPKASDVTDDIILRNVVKLEQVSDPISPVIKILQRCNKHVILSIYKIPDFSTPNEFLIHVARKNGKLMKGGIPNIHVAARMVLQDWTGGKIPFYTDPPVVGADVHVSAQLVTEFAPDFDINQAKVLASLRDDEDLELQGTSLGSSSAPISVEDMFVDSDEEDEIPILTKASSSKAIEYEDEEEDDEDDEVLPVRVAEPKKSKANTTANQPSKKQDLTDDADQFNPQTNKLKKKQLKTLQKDKKKGVKKGAAFGDYDFAADYADQDIDADDIDMD